MRASHSLAGGSLERAHAARSHAAHRRAALQPRAAGACQRRSRRTRSGVPWPRATSCATPQRHSCPQHTRVAFCSAAGRCCAGNGRERVICTLCECSEQPGEPRPPSSPFSRTPVRAMAGAAGSAAIAARGISVGKEIVIASGLGLVAGGVFKARARKALGCCGPARAARARRACASRCRAKIRRRRTGCVVPLYCRCSARASATLTQRARHARVAGVALEQPPQGGAVLCGPEQGEGL